MIRLNVDHDARGLMPFVVRFREGWTTAQGFRRTAPGQFGLAVNHVDEQWTDVEHPQPGVDR
jgi:hypothetical protein